MSSKSEQSQRYVRVAFIRFQYSRNVTAHRDMKMLKKTVPPWSKRRPAWRKKGEITVMHVARYPDREEK